MNNLKGSKTEENLLTAFAGESMARNKYTFYASQAKKEGYEQIANIFLETANNEKEHAKLWYRQSIKKIRFNSSLPQQFKRIFICRCNNSKVQFDFFFGSDSPDFLIKLIWCCQKATHIIFPNTTSHYLSTFVSNWYSSKIAFASSDKIYS